MLDSSIDLPTNGWAAKVTRTAVTGFLRVIYTILNASVILERNEMLLARNEKRLERNETRLERNKKEVVTYF